MAPTSPTSPCGDIVTAQKAMLDGLGVTHLVAVAGPSFGGYQAFQWAVTYPDCNGRRRGGGHAPREATGGQEAVDTLPEAPGRRSRRGTAAGTTITAGIVETMTGPGASRTLQNYGSAGGSWRARSPDPAARDAALAPPGRGVGARVRSQLTARATQGLGASSTPPATSRRSAPRCSTCCRARTSSSRPRWRPASWPSSPGGRHPGNVLRDRHGARPRGQRSGVGQVDSDAPRLPGRARACVASRRQTARRSCLATTTSRESSPGRGSDRLSPPSRRPSWWWGSPFSRCRPPCQPLSSSSSALSACR